jgi:hypothetical protein
VEEESLHGYARAHTQKVERCPSQTLIIDGEEREPGAAETESNIEIAASESDLSVPRRCLHARRERGERSNMGCECPFAAELRCRGGFSFKDHGAGAEVP